MTIRKLIPEDWASVKSIYLQGIATGNATFQTEAPEWEAWDNSHLSFCRLVAFKDGVIVGWCALSPVSSRCIYAGVAEVSVYINTNFWGQHIGSTLLQHLITESEENGIWTLQAGIFPENTASLKLHERSGFRVLGFREKIGKMNNVWRDTVLLERRSLKIL